MNNTAVLPNVNTSISSPLKLAQPSNLLGFMVFYSPIIIATSFVSLSFIFQNFNGFIYLAFLLGACSIREVILYYAGMAPMIPANNLCTMIQYSKYGNSGFSVFVMSFTIAYVLLPMFLVNSINYFMMGGLLAYFFMDIGIRYSKKCITTAIDTLLNFLSGAAIGVGCCLALYYGKGSNYLFYNNLSSDNVVCSMPKKQTFKCSVYKNGELVSSNISS
jgi:hypothetical protein